MRPQNIRRPAKGQRKRIRKQSDAGGGDGDGGGAGGRKDAEARMREDLFGADNAGAAAGPAATQPVPQAAHHHHICSGTRGSELVSDCHAG